MTLPPLRKFLAQYIDDSVRPAPGITYKEWLVLVTSFEHNPALAFAIRYVCGGVVSSTHASGHTPAVLCLYGPSGTGKTASARIATQAVGGHEISGPNVTPGRINAALRRPGALLVDEVSVLTPKQLGRLIYGATERPWPTVLTSNAPPSSRVNRELLEPLRRRLLELHVAAATGGTSPGYVATRKPAPQVAQELARRLSAPITAALAGKVRDGLMRRSRITAADRYVIWGIACARATDPYLGIPTDANDRTTWVLNQYLSGGIETAAEHFGRALREELHRHRDALSHWPNMRKHKAICAVAQPWARDYGNGMLAIPVDTINNLLRREGLTIAALRAWAGEKLKEGPKLRLLPKGSPGRVFIIDAGGLGFNNGGTT